jgi:TolB-like protein/Tfp pilus assembly protein PilF
VTLLGLALRLNVGGWRKNLLGRVSPVRIQSVVVLPFDNLTGDPAQDYFADGMTDALTTELAQIQALRVISRTSAMRYKGPRKLLPQVAAELNVDAVVEGSVRRSGGRVWMTAQLIDAHADRHLWAKPYDRELRDAPTLQWDVARDMVREMHIDLTPQERTQLARARAVNPQAYDYYLRGRFYSANENKNDVEIGIGLLEQAIAIDRTFALAYAGLAFAYLTKGQMFEPGEKQWQEEALVAATTALALDPDLAEAHLARAIVLTDKSEVTAVQKVAEFRRALSLNPNLDEAHHLLGSFYNHLGLLDRAADELHKAVAINPANTGGQYRIGINLLFQCQYEQAVTRFNGTRRFSPSLWGFHMAFALFHLGRRDEAAVVVGQSLQELPRDEGGLLASMQAMLAAAAGDDRTAEERIKRAIDVGHGYVHFHHTAYAIGSAYALLNKPESALKWLQTAAADGFPCYPLFEKDSSLDSLRKEPHFMDFMARLRKHWEYYKAAV